MTLQQLRYFCEVARQNMNISQAAAALHITQPGLSRQLRLLEEELKVELFVRNRTRLVRLSDAGRELVAMAGHTLESADNIKKANPGKQVFVLQDSLQTLDDGKYAGGGTNSMSSVRSVEMLTDWAKANTGVVMFVGQVTKDGEFAGKQTILHAVDVRGHLYIDEEKKSRSVLFLLGAVALGLLVLPAAAGARLLGQGGVVQDGEDPEVILLPDRVILVIMALRTFQRGSQPDHAQSVHPIEHLVHPGFLGVTASFHIGWGIAVESRGYLLFQRWVG